MTAGAFPRWGILATGGIARLFTRDLLAHGHRVVAVGSRSAASAKKFASELGIPRAHASYEALVADPEVDVVYVATPHNVHAANALLALEHGKHVLVEKAFTLTAAEAAQVTETARAKGLVALEAMWTRFLPHMAFVRSVIRDGRLGQLRSLHADHSQFLPFPDDHRLNDPHRAGGALLDLGVYPISFAVEILGAPLDITARATFKRTGVDASVATIFVHDGDTLSTTYSTMQARGRNQATVLGSDGRLEIDAVWYGPAKVTVYDSGGVPVEVYDQPVTGRGMQFQAAELERLVREEQIASPLIPPEESVRVMRVMDSIRKQIGLRYPGE